MQSLGLTFLDSVLWNPEAGYDMVFIRNVNRFGQETMLLILGCVVFGKNILNEVPGITSSVCLPEKSDLFQSFPTTLTRMMVITFTQPPVTHEAINFQFDVRRFYSKRSARSDLLWLLQGWAHIWYTRTMRTSGARRAGAVSVGTQGARHGLLDQRLQADPFLVWTESVLSVVVEDTDIYLKPPLTDYSLCVVLNVLRLLSISTWNPSVIAFVSQKGKVFRELAQAPASVRSQSSALPLELCPTLLSPACHVIAFPVWGPPSCSKLGKSQVGNRIFKRRQVLGYMWFFFFLHSSFHIH